MALQSASRPGPGAALDFLCVDEFLRTLVDARALKTAFELGLVDRLCDGGGTVAGLQQELAVDATGMGLLLGMLESNRVVERRGEDVSLHPTFRQALGFRDLLETRLDFAGFTLNDFADLFTALVRDPAQFMGQAQLFQLFDYRRCLEDKGDNYQRTRAWMRLTSTLTRYEARGCLALHDFSACRRMLDIGGNSGEFALQMCRANPALSATVFDLPLVCQVGMEHLLGEPEQERIGFVRGDARHDPLPSGHDLVSFKSMLHDWPEDEARAFLDKAIAALEPGGTLLIFERVPIDASAQPLPFSMLPILLFFRSYRSPQFYVGHLALRGMEQIVHREIDLDTRFMLLTARKPRS